MIEKHPSGAGHEPDCILYIICGLPAGENIPYIILGLKLVDRDKIKTIRCEATENPWLNIKLVGSTAKSPK